MSSVLGGIVTLLLVLIVGTYSIEMLVSTIRKVHYNLDIHLEEITAYQKTDNDTILKNLTSCNSEKCRDI